MSAPARLSGYDVAVSDHGVDAMIVETPGLPPMVVLRPGMSFGAAVEALHSIVPFASPDEVRALVRAHLPDAPDLNIAVDEVLDSPARRPDVRAHGGTLIVASMVAALLVSASLIVAGVAGLEGQIAVARVQAAGDRAQVRTEMQAAIRRIVARQERARAEESARAYAKIPAKRHKHPHVHRPHGR